MNSKQQILNALRAAQLPDAELPSTSGPWTTYADCQAQFCEVLEAVGGQAAHVAGPSEIAPRLKLLTTYQQARNVWSLVPGVDSAGGRWDEVADPHELESLDFCLVRGQFGVAENGAVWISDDAVPHRAALFVAQHLVLVIPATEIVPHMHGAYDRITFEDERFGIFISGPSKTADIEQSLVIGAHGARSLTVVLVDHMSPQP